MATIVKLNEEELPVVCKLVGLDRGAAVSDDQRASTLCDQYNLKMLALTRGSRGTVLYSDGSKYSGAEVVTHTASDADGVGAGDACCAAILYGILHGWNLQKTATLANRIGAFVASCPGATPKLPDELLPVAAPRQPAGG